MPNGSPEGDFMTRKSSYVGGVGKGLEKPCPLGNLDFKISTPFILYWGVFQSKTSQMQSIILNENIVLFISCFLFFYALFTVRFETNPWREELFPMSPRRISKESIYIIGSDIPLSSIHSKMNEREVLFFNHGVADNTFVDLKHAYETYLEHTPSLARELYKFTLIYRKLEQNQQIYYYNGVLISNFDHLLGNYVSITRNGMVHDSMLVVRNDQLSFLRKVIRYLVDTVDNNPMSNHETSFREWMYNAIKYDSNWIQLPVVCDKEDNTQGCPSLMKYCCQVTLHPLSTHPSHIENKAFVLTKEIATYTKLKLNVTATLLPTTDIIDMRNGVSDTTILSEESYNIETQNNFQIFQDKENCLPIEEHCALCLNYYGICSICKPLCKCFCDTICTEIPREQERHEMKLVLHSAPQHTRDHGRLIPRIVHQIWHESVTKDKYPNFSRFAGSWNQTNWEYKFWSDQDASNFISVHFPREVKEAYDALVPGPFRADLFRYCVLFIYGGVYADVDVLSESNLEMILEPNVGFMIPLDVGTKGIHDTSYCLWNGLIFSAPGHPFLAMAIKNVVNRINNRFTLVDHVRSLCTDDGLEIDFTVFNYGPSIFTGSCILGTSINSVLGRSPQSHFSPIEHVDIPSNNDIPGSLVILSANNNDMGALRFTILKKNLLVASTGMEAYDYKVVADLSIVRNKYSSIKLTGLLRGIEGLYTPYEPKNEN